MTTLPTSPASQLPPWIVPTLPETETTPSGLIVPKQAPTTSGGLVIVRDELSQVRVGSKLVVPTAPVTGDGALDAAKQAYAELASRQGEAAAQIVHGGAVALATQVRNDEIRAEAVAAFLAGDLARWTELLASLH